MLKFLKLIQKCNVQNLSLTQNQLISILSASPYKYDSKTIESLLYNAFQKNFVSKSGIPTQYFLTIEGQHFIKSQKKKIFSRILLSISICVGFLVTMIVYNRAKITDSKKPTFTSSNATSTADTTLAKIRGNVVDSLQIKLANTTKQFKDSVKLARSQSDNSSHKLGFLKIRPMKIDVSDSFKTLQSQNAYRYLKLLSKKGTLDSTLTLVYYTKPLDKGVVSTTLKRIGYNHFRVGISRQNHIEFQTNAIAFGERVALFDLKIVLLSLLRAGCTIKYVMRIDDNPEVKQHQIQIIRHIESPEDPPLSADHIYKAKKVEDLINIT